MKATYGNVYVGLWHMFTRTGACASGKNGLCARPSCVAMFIRGMWHFLCMHSLILNFGNYWSNIK